MNANGLADFLPDHGETLPKHMRKMEMCDAQHTREHILFLRTYANIEPGRPISILTLITRNHHCANDHHRYCTMDGFSFNPELSKRVTTVHDNRDTFGLTSQLKLNNAPLKSNKSIVFQGITLVILCCLPSKIL